MAKPEHPSEKFEYSDLLDHTIECFTGKYPKGYTFGLHWHYFMEILLMKKGEIELQIGSRYVRAKGGDMIVLLPSVMHSIRMCSETTEYYGIKFKPGNMFDQHGKDGLRMNEVSLFKLAGMDNSVRSYFPGSLVDTTDIRYLMDLSIREMNGHKHGYLGNINCAVKIILTDIIRIWENEGLSPDKLGTSETENLTLEAIPSYIEDNISENIKVEDLATLCSLSYSGFAKKFMKMFGTSCKNYIETIRIRKVAELLKNSEKDLSTISQETGFSDTSHMIRFFKKIYGETPKKYRDK
ncbi:MAG: AraC family transcriptional regulator [Lachnospiraceae bacterium]|nr:AraC family transcriptional regulator [Lachnospiraceae bacterium]